MPYNVNIDPEAASRLLDRTAVVLLLDVPPGSQVGFDHQRFGAGPLFKGLKLVPPGVHYIHYSVAGKVEHGGGYSAITSFFVTLTAGQVCVRKWDANVELLLPVDDDESIQYDAAVRQRALDANLAPYNLTQYGVWQVELLQRWLMSELRSEDQDAIAVVAQSLTSFITPDLVDRLSPIVPLSISVLAEAAPDGQQPSAAETALSQQLAQHMVMSSPGERPSDAVQVCSRMTWCIAVVVGAGSTLPEQAAPSAVPSQGSSGQDAASSLALTQQQYLGCCYYATIPRRLKKPGLSAAELTALNLDKTVLLQQLIGKEYGGDGSQLIGEMQFAFLTFLCGQSLQGFAQWKSVLELAFSCIEGPVSSLTQLFVDLLKALAAQLHLMKLGNRTEAPDGLAGMVAEELEGDVSLRSALKRFVQGLAEEEHVPASVMQQLLHVQSLCKEALGWDVVVEEVGLDDDADEDAPVVVDTL